MKRFLFAAAMAAVLTAPTLAHDGYRATDIKVPTVQCGMCEEKIENGLKNLKGLDSVDVDLEKKIVRVVFDVEKTSLATIEKAISELGYAANDTKANAKAQAKLSPCCRPGGMKH